MVVVVVVAVNDVVVIVVMVLVVVVVIQVYALFHTYCLYSCAEIDSCVYACVCLRVCTQSSVAEGKIHTHRHIIRDSRRKLRKHLF